MTGRTAKYPLRPQATVVESFDDIEDAYEVLGVPTKTRLA
jgi:hypothetical protein